MWFSAPDSGDIHLLINTPPQVTTAVQQVACSPRLSASPSAQPFIGDTTRSQPFAHRDSSGYKPTRVRMHHTRRSHLTQNKTDSLQGNRTYPGHRSRFRAIADGCQTGSDASRQNQRHQTGRPTTITVWPAHRPLAAQIYIETIQRYPQNRT